VKLYEFEGHKILSKTGIDSPHFVVCENLDEVREAKKRIKFPIVAKVQVLSGKRGKSGGVGVCKNEKQLEDFCKEYFGKDFPPSHEASDGQGGGEEVRFISLSEYVDIESEFYASITYDTVLKIPFLLFSVSGGMDIEEVRAGDPGKIVRLDIDPFSGPNQKDLAKITGKNKNLSDFLMRLWDGFCRYDCRLLEVNPIAKVGKNYMAIDAKIILDDAALFRHRDIDVLPKGSASAVATKLELDARKIDADDYRGSAGSTFIEFDGDIAVLASGGGASLLVMDALVEAGGKCANYTEYSGNPPGDKVEKLTLVTLGREGLNGCLVAGAVANFTDIYETLSGFARGLMATRPKIDFPIVIRRGGPRQKEAYGMLLEFAKKEGFDIHLFGPETPISTAAKKMVELSNNFKLGKQN